MAEQSEVVGPFKKLLVATDFSPHALAAFRSAAWLAQASGGEIILAHVVEDISATVAALSYDSLLIEDIRAVERDLCQDSHDRLAALEQELRPTGLKVQKITLVGQQVVELTHLAQSERCDLVVCGSQGHSALQGFLLGSTAKRLVRKCPTAVWSTHSSVPASPTAVLAAVDFSELSRAALLHARWVAQAASAPLHVVHVLEPRTLDGALLEAVSRRSGEHWRDEMRAAARRRLNAFVQEALGDPVEPSLHVDFGEPWEYIRDTARQIKANLIVLGTVGRTGIQGLWLGNTAERLLNVMDCGVLTIKPPGFVSPIAPAEAARR